MKPRLTAPVVRGLQYLCEASEDPEYQKAMKKEFPAQWRDIVKAKGWVHDFTEWQKSRLELQ